MQTYSLLLYGTDVCPMNSADRHSLQFTINKIMYKIFGAMSNDLYIEISAHFGIESVENLIADRRNRSINRYGETDNYLCQMLRWLVQFVWLYFLFIVFVYFRLLIFSFFSFMLCYHICWWNKVVYNARLTKLTYVSFSVQGQGQRHKSAWRHDCTVHSSYTTRGNVTSAGWQVTLEIPYGM